MKQHRFALSIVTCLLILSLIGSHIILSSKYKKITEVKLIDFAENSKASLARPIAQRKRIIKTQIRNHTAGLESPKSALTTTNSTSKSASDQLSNALIIEQVFNNIYSSAVWEPKDGAGILYKLNYFKI
jgi:hypothetical protein